MSNDSTSAAMDRLRMPLYALAVLLVMHPVGDFVANVWPLRVGEVEWRYGVMGLLSGFLMTPMLGLAIAVGVGAVGGDRVLLKVLGWLSVVTGVLLLVLTVFFALEIIQFRPSVPTEGLGQYDIGSWKAVIKHLITAPVIIMLGRVALASARLPR